MANAELVTEGQLAQFHVAVEKAFSDGFEISLKIDSSNERFDWKSALPTTKVFFAAKPTRKSLVVESSNEPVAAKNSCSDSLSLMQLCLCGFRGQKSGLKPASSRRGENPRQCWI